MIAASLIGVITMAIETERHAEPEIRGLGRAADHIAPEFYARDIIAAYNGIRAFESDFDRAQGQLRTIASTWLLAGIGAIGFVINAQIGGTVGADASALLRQTLFLLIALGMTWLWRLDQNVYQNMINNAFALGYWIEYRYECVPPTRMALYHANKDITSHLGQFYKRPISLVMACAVGNTVHAVATVTTFQLSGLTRDTFVLSVSAILFAHFLYFVWLLCETSTWGSLQWMLPKPADDAKERRANAPPRDPFTSLGAYRQPANGAPTPPNMPVV